ncbi:TonB family protein [Dyadobacter sandarakinus]|uniref:TonB family protein n=1 Tax=Dyadobacter sandarakinus TaxID=2747268 RepID=A0ABX7I5G4_9BACT|nr:TonB family protein [Dyadobacter sandarakinus]QRR00732.1 TonB family protein [Dyadobacter sandarakinus]
MLIIKQVFRRRTCSVLCIGCLLVQLAATGLFAQQAPSNKPKYRIIFTVVEQQPEFPGGQQAMDQYFADHLSYPAEADDKYRSKVIFARFIVSDSGAIDSVRVLKPVNKLVDEEVIRVVKNMPVWIPARQSGRPVAMWYNVPVRFPEK